MHDETIEELSGALILANKDAKTAQSENPILSEFIDLVKKNSVSNDKPKFSRLYLQIREKSKVFGRDLSEIDWQRGDSQKANYAASASAISNVIGQVKAGRSKRDLPILVWWAFEYHYDVAREFFYRRVPESRRIIEGDALRGKKIDVFLCWTGAYAQEIASRIRSFFDPFEDRLEAFLSSTDLHNGIWSEELKVRIKETAQGIVLVTQDVIDSEYFVHDFSLLNASAQKISTLRIDAPLAMIPEPVRPSQAPELNRRSLEAALKSVFDQRRIPFPIDAFNNLMADIKEIREQRKSRFVTTENERWDGNFSRPIAMNDQSTSPYDLEQVLRTVQSKLVLIAQNHWFMTNSDVAGDKFFWPLVQSALDRGVDIDIIGMHATAPPAKPMATTVPDASLLWAHYLQVVPEKFNEQREECWVVIKEWLLRSESNQRSGALKAFGTYFCPTTFSVVDPTSADGYLILSPRVDNEASGSRPHFIIRRRHESVVFKYYWEAIKNGYGSGSLTRMQASEL